MVPEVQEFADRFDEIRRQARDAIQNLDERGLNSTPLDQDTSSPAVLVHHMAGVEGFWLRQIIGGVDIGRNRPDELLGTQFSRLRSFMSMREERRPSRAPEPGWTLHEETFR